MGQIKRHAPAIITLAISALLACIPLGTGALGVELAALQGPKAMVTNVRVGAHRDKTRVVLDISKPTDFGYDLSADKKAVFIELPGVKWTAPPFEPRHFRGNILEFHFSPVATGGRFNILTDQPVSIRKPFFVGPSGKHGHRIVIDLIPSKFSRTPTTTYAPRQESIHQAKFSNSTPLRENKRMVAGLHNVGASNQGPSVGTASQEPPKIMAELPNSQRKLEEIAHSPAQNPFLNPVVPQYQGGFLGYQNIYLKAAAGVNILPEIVNTGSNGNDNTMELDPGFAFAGGLGMNLVNDIRLEGEIIYTSTNTLDQIVGSANGLTVSSTATEGDVSSLAFMANVAYDVSNQGTYIPFVTAGVGMAGVFMNGMKVDGTLIADSKDWVFAMQAGGGISLPVDPGTVFEISYRYFETRDPEFGDERDQPFSSQIASHSVMLGARLKF